MPGTLDINLNPVKSARPVSVDPTLYNKSQSGKAYKRKFGNPQYWQFDFVTAELSPDEAWELYAFIVSQGGRFGNFYITNPFFNKADSPSTSNSIAISKGESSFTLIANNYAVGDFIQWANHDKAYLITSVVGDTVGFYPSLITSVAHGTAIKYGKQVEFYVELENDSQDIIVEANRGNYSEVRIRCIEVHL
jgi:hypothetical protein